MNDLLHVFILSLLPGIEARYAIIYGLYKNLNIKNLVIICSISIFLLSIILSYIIHLLDKVVKQLSQKYNILYKMYVKYILSIRKRFKPYERYGVFGLIIFVAIPLPISGIYTGAFISYILGLNKTKTFLSLFLGGNISMMIVSIPIIIL